MIQENKEIEQNIYKIFLKERQEMLDRIPEEERKRIELEINLFLAEHFKKIKEIGNQFFDYTPFLENEHIKEHFSIIATAGDRNIGKTTSLQKLYRDVVADGKRYIHLRNIQSEVEEAIVSDEEKFLNAIGVKNKTSKKKPNLHDLNDKLVGWYRDINTIGNFKSIEFPNTGIIGYEEYNSNVRVSGDKWTKLSEFLTTVQRHQKNLKVIMQANYVSQDDAILQNLGVGLEKLGKRLCIINWITGAIVIFIPKGIYKSTGDTVEEKSQYLGYRTSLMNFNTWKGQFSGTFTNHYQSNIINHSSIHAVLDPVFNISFSRTIDMEINLTLYECITKNQELVYMLINKMGDNNADTFVFDNISELRNINAVRIEYNQLEYLINSWKSDIIKTDSKETYEMILRIFSEGKKAVDADAFTIDEIEDYV